MRVFILVISVGMACVTRCQATDVEAFLDKFRYGIEIVHRLFSGGAASRFKTFFAGAFSSDSSKLEDNFAGNVFDAVIQTLGGNQEEIGVAGLRMSVLVAKMISDAFPQNARAGRSADEDFSPLETILRQQQIQSMIMDVLDPNLTDRIRSEFGRGNDTDCMRLLICKLSPFVRGMQTSVKFFAGADQGGRMEKDAWAKAKPLERMYLFMPGLNEFLENGDECDERHPSCVY